MTRAWEDIICYQDTEAFRTSRWRLWGVRTRSGLANTDDGVLWLSLTGQDDGVAASLSLDRAGVSTQASGTLEDVRSLDGSADEALEITLDEVADSGLSASLYLHAFQADASCPLQVALCTDEDLRALWDGVEDLTAYESLAGLAECIRLAGSEMLARVIRMYPEQLGATARAWYLDGSDRFAPDLGRLANPAQLRYPCSCLALAHALGRDHQRADDTAYSRLRDHFFERYETAMSSLRLAFTTDGVEPDRFDNPASVRLDRA